MQMQTSDAQFELIYQNLCKDDRFCFDLRMQFEKILKAEQERYRAYSDLANFLSGLAKEPFQETISIIEMLEELAKSIQEVNLKYMEKYNDDQDKGLIKLLKSKIIPSLVDGQRSVEVQKKALNEYKEKAIRLKKLEQKKEEYMMKNDDKLLNIEKQVQEARREKLEKGQTFNFTYQNYVEDKNDELKGLFKHFFNRLLVISTAGLQHYSLAINKVHTTNEIKEIEFQLGELGIIKRKKK
ncbi:unnamed protein product (macronuclear) [Paramecium tetraurelia]|uniref:Uncharacterized protein n=1 Tax=Paramecium tetraurelia TaxID=5888 RepID=A0DWR4_PARTE|nr:uncharacterized protein GSPATT00021124001 [Paramecium tetraurelia]CAK87481.1 unnamed protein product [Paramecium tetraurelia]|eukprot:XP_001454878.1 hypothetical protein (macronuclear) [Paramecium tetraurelia strain d4-2]